MKYIKPLPEEKLPEKQPLKLFVIFYSSIESPYPGANMFSLASGGAIYVRDPKRKLVDEQLNGGEYVQLSDEDWTLILPYLQENEKLFGISIENDLLTVDGIRKSPKEVYIKVQPKI